VRGKGEREAAARQLAWSNATGEKLIPGCADPKKVVYKSRWCIKYAEFPEICSFSRVLFIHHAGKKPKRGV